MNPTIQEEDITEYASDATTIQEPQGVDYTVGARVGRTIPAKWWNWLFKAATKRLHQAFTDFSAVFAEAKNVVLDAEIIPSADDSAQMTQAIASKADNALQQYITGTIGFLTEWNTVGSISKQVGRKQGSYGYGGYGGCTLEAYATDSKSVLAIHDVECKAHIAELPREPYYDGSSENTRFELIYLGHAYLLLIIRGQYTAFDARFTWMLSTDLYNFIDITALAKATVQRLDGTFTIREDGSVLYYNSVTRSLYNIAADGTIGLLSVLTVAGSASVSIAYVDGVTKSISYGSGLVWNSCYYDLAQKTIGSISDAGAAYNATKDSNYYKLSNGAIVVPVSYPNSAQCLFNGTINIPVTWRAGTDYDYSVYVPGSTGILCFRKGNNFSYTRDGVTFAAITNPPPTMQTPDYGFGTSIVYSYGLYTWRGYKSNNLTDWTATGVADKRSTIAPFKGLSNAWYTSPTKYDSAAGGYVTEISTDNCVSFQKVKLTTAYNIDTVGSPVTLMLKAFTGAIIAVRWIISDLWPNDTLQLNGASQTQLTKNRVLGNTLYLR